LDSKIESGGDHIIYGIHRIHRKVGKQWIPQYSNGFGSNVEEFGQIWEDSTRIW